MSGRITAERIMMGAVAAVGTYRIEIQKPHSDSKGVMRGALEVSRPSEGLAAIIYADQVNLTSASQRKKAAAAIVAAGVTAEASAIESVLLALLKACQRPPPRAGPEAEPASSVTVERSEGAVILSEAEAALTRFVAYPSEAARVAHTLWIAHTHLMGAWYSTPRIAFLSPEKGSGKTRALEITAELVPHPVPTANISAAALYRVIGAPGALPVMMLDEADTIFRDERPSENAEAIRGLVNAGHRRGQKTLRVGGSDRDELKEFEAYSAVALAGLGDLPETIISRSVVVQMRRRGPGERVEAFRHRLDALELHTIQDRMAAWAALVEPEIVQAMQARDWPAMPAGVTDRDADVWEDLFAVADMAGGDWPERIRVAAIELIEQARDSTPSLGVQLLADLRDIFGDAIALTTEQIIGRLCELPESPWQEVVSGKPINARGLAQRLRAYGVRSRKVRPAGGDPLQGYRREDLFDVWTRYLPTLTQTPVERPEQAEHPEQTPENLGIYADFDVPDSEIPSGTPPEHPARVPEPCHLSRTTNGIRPPVFMRNVPDVPHVPDENGTRDTYTRNGHQHESSDDLSAEQRDRLETMNRDYAAQQEHVEPGLDRYSA
jgi:hypothetical protein